MAHIKREVRQNCINLNKTPMRFEDIYNIVFSYKDNVMAEYNTSMGPQSVTYKEAQENIERISVVLMKEYGTGEFIGLYAENCAQWIVLFWAILRSGNKPYLVNLRQPLSFSKGILDTLCVKLVLCKDTCPDFERESLDYEVLLQKSRKYNPKDKTEFADEFALSTSGTTLKEKICVYSGKEVSFQILNIASMQEKNSGFVETYKGRIKMLAFLPLYHIFGLEAMYLWYSFWGSTFVFLNSMNPDNILYTIRRYEVTHIFAVPLLWENVEKSLLRTIGARDEKTQKKFEKAVKLSLKIQNFSPVLGKSFAKSMLKDVRRRLFGDSVRFCISGGSAIKESTLRLINALGYELYNGYGMSEIGITSVELSRKVYERIEGSIGKPFDSVEYRIGEDNKLFVRGKSICKSVIIEGKEHSTEDFFDTGDVMEQDKRGCYHIKGRISDVVFSSDGENLNPDFSEDAFVLSEAEALCVLGNEDNSKLMLVVKLFSQLPSASLMKLKEKIQNCNASLPASYQVKEVYYTIDPIMDSLAIKVSRAYLRKAISEGRVVLHTFEEQTDVISSENDNEIREALRELFCKVLRKKPEDITDTGHFMNDLGGTSLDYFTLVGEIDNRFGITLGFESEQFGYSINDFERIIKEMIG